jgi:DNA polymerase bacteriophage-type
VKLYLDFETRSTVDLPATGAYVYAEDPATFILCAAFALEGEEVEVATGGPEQAQRWDRLLALLRDPLVSIVAHNAEFERLILRGCLGLNLHPSRFRCTAAQSARAGLPRSLDAAGQVLQLAELKDKATGSRVVAKLCKPRRPSKTNPDLFWEPATAPEDFRELYEYCAQDVRTTRLLHRTLPPLTDSEQAIWELTVRMNDRGLKVDTEAVPLAIAAANAATEKLAARFQELVGVEHGAVVKAAEALGLPDLTKATVRRELKCAQAGWRREALEIRQKVARSSVAKLQAFLDRTSYDGRIRGMLVYSGAERTARWSGMGVQPQNFPRGFGEDTEAAFAALRNGTLEGLGDGDVLGSVSNMLRGFFLGPLLGGDYAQIEARALAWLAGQEDLVRAFAQGEDVYCQMASAIWNRPVKAGDTLPELASAGVDMRFVGKTAVLGCGYGLGAVKFRSQLDDQFGVTVSEGFAQKVVQAYRTRYAQIPAFWYRLEDAFRYTIRTGAKKLTHPKLRGLSLGMRSYGGRPFAAIVLPSGREMLYFDPQVGTDNRITYVGRNQYAGGRWERVDTYGGKLAENVVQAVSRDAMAAAMLRLDAAGFPLVLTVHDEVVADTGERAEEFLALMAERPEWAPDLPLVVKGGVTQRYQK